MKDTRAKLIKFRPETIEAVQAMAKRQNRTFTAQVRHICQKAIQDDLERSEAP